MRRSVIRWLVITLATLIPAMTFAGDQEIAKHIVDTLKSEKESGNLKGFGLDMHVDQGTVWFQGHVSNKAQKDLVIKTAQQAKKFGLTQIVDDIEVKTAESSATPTKIPAATIASQTTKRLVENAKNNEPELAESKKIRQVSNTTPLRKPLASSRRGAVAATPLGTGTAAPTVTPQLARVPAAAPIAGPQPQHIAPWWRHRILCFANRCCKTYPK